MSARAMRKAAAVLAAGLLAAALSGCADSAPLPYPKIEDIERITRKVLTPEEREKAIRDLSMAQKTHKSTAISEIEKR